MSRRRKPTPQNRYIWEQLERLYQAQLRSQDSPKVPIDWQKLWRETVAGDRLGAVHVDDAGDVLYWGWVLAMKDGFYDAATDVLSPYFSHPQIL